MSERIAHDFTNIVNAIRGYADLLTTDLPPDGQTHRYARKIVEICERAATLIADIESFPDAQAAPREPAQINSGSELRGCETVLIVDDEVAIAEVLTTALSRWGYEAAGIYFPREALETFKEDPSAWDVVVMDYSMPRMSGLDLLAELKAIRPDLKTIIFTGYSQPGTREAAERLGVDAFLSKPVSVEDVARTIRRINR